MEQSTTAPRRDTRHLWRFNDYRVEGNTAILTLRDKHREPCAETIIDLWDVDRVREAACWRRVEPTPGFVYVYGTLRGPDVPPGKEIIVGLHRLIVGCPVGMEVDHWNGDGLDNRRENLRVVTRSGNARNERGHRRIRDLEAALRAVLRCAHKGERCVCKRRALALLDKPGMD